MRIICISDTHNKHKKLNLPAVDMIIHAGDFTQKGKPNEIEDFFNWFANQDAKYKIFVAGNHDFGMEGEKRFYFEKLACELGLIYLNDTAIVIEGIKIFGSPITPWFHDWAFNCHRGAEIKKHWDLIPIDTDLLITHGPPMNILDQTWRKIHVGCEELEKKIHELQNVKLHIFGHIHEAKGEVVKNNVKFINASSLSGFFNGNLSFTEIEL